MEKIFKNKIFWIFLLALLVRFAYVFSLSKDYLSSDSGDWNHLAFLILGGGQYDSTYRGPLYPLFLAGIYSLFGYNVLAVRIIQSFIDALTCLFVYFIGKRVFSSKIGITAALIAAFYPYLIYYSGDVLSETVFTFFVSSSVLLLLLCQERFLGGRSIIAGISIGLASLCKGVFFLFFVLAIFWLLITSQNRFKERLKTSLLITVCVIFTILPWTIRNYFFYNKVVLFGLSGQSLWLANNPLSYKLETLPEMNIDRLNDFVGCDKKKQDEILRLNPVQADALFRTEAKKFIYENPKVFIKLSFKRFVHYWRLYPIIATRRNKIIALCTSGWILPFAWLGIIFSFKEYWRKTTLLILLLVSFSFLHMIFLANIRYRVPIDPIIIVFSAFTIHKFLRLK